MNFLRNTQIAAKLALGFGVLLAMMAAMVAVGVLQLSDIGRRIDALVQDDWAAAAAAASVDATTRSNARRTMELFFAADTAQADAVRAHVRSNRQAIDAALQTLQRHVGGAEGAALMAEVTSTRAAYVASFTEVDRLLVAGQREAASQLLMTRTLPTLDQLQAKVAQLSSFQYRAAQASAAGLHDQAASTRQVLMAIGAAMLAAGALLSWRLGRAIGRPINDAVGIAERVAHGDLSMHIEAGGRDETGRLLQALHHMNQSLVRLVGDVRNSSECIATGSGQIAAGTTDLSQRTEQQAANLQQTAASMEQLAGTVRHSADTARAAADMAAQVCERASDGGAAVRRVVQTMEDITTVSRKIGDITGVIDGIAFQTNLLALNAAVEAARAGEQGKGFAVVAGEVRSLAQRSAAAAREIGSLVQATVGRIEDGGATAGEAGRTIGAVVEQVKRVSGLISEVSAAAGEQAKGIAQINTAVAQLDQVTQQNAALVEESAAATDSLKSQAHPLVGAVRAFRLKTGAA